MFLCFSWMNKFQSYTIILVRMWCLYGWHKMLLFWGAVILACLKGPTTPLPCSICSASVSVNPPALAAFWESIYHIAGVSPDLGDFMIHRGSSSWADGIRGSSPRHNLSVSVVPQLWMLYSSRTCFDKDAHVSFCFFHAQLAACKSILQKQMPEMSFDNWGIAAPGPDLWESLVIE